MQLQQPYTTQITGKNQTPIDYEFVQKLLDEGQVVALPTETVYGLAANATNAQAIKRIYEAKGRPSNNPLIVHVGRAFKTIEALVDKKLIEQNFKQEKRWKVAQLLMDRFWPGPLTIILPKGSALPLEVSAGLNTIGLRMPSHPIFLKLLDQLSYPLAAPSANRSNHISPTKASHVLNDLNGRIPLIVDGGETAVGLESTIVSVDENGEVKILRQGGLPQQHLMAVLSTITVEEMVHDDTAPLSPGRLKVHYAPERPLYLVKENFSAKLKAILSSLPASTAVGILRMHDGPKLPSTWETTSLNLQFQVWTLGDFGDGTLAAKALYKTLREMDESGVELLLVEVPQKTSEGLWPAILDRLNRASSKTQ